jgi:hypothetical protein
VKLPQRSSPNKVYLIEEDARDEPRGSGLRICQGGKLKRSRLEGNDGDALRAALRKPRMQMFFGLYLVYTTASART